MSFQEFEAQLGSEIASQTPRLPAAASVYAASGSQDIFDLELECQRQFGDENYSFYRPEYAGDFTIQTWRVSNSSPRSTPRTQSAQSDRVYAVTIYQNGEIVDFSKDLRFKKFNWVDRNKSLHDQYFSRRDIEVMIRQLTDLSRKERAAAIQSQPYTPYYRMSS